MPFAKTRKTRLQKRTHFTKCIIRTTATTATTDKLSISTKGKAKIQASKQDAEHKILA